jgi:hypothetical protein
VAKKKPREAASGKLNRADLVASYEALQSQIRKLDEEVDELECVGAQMEAFIRGKKLWDEFRHWQAQQPAPPREAPPKPE